MCPTDSSQYHLHREREAESSDVLSRRIGGETRGYPIEITVKRKFVIFFLSSYASLDEIEGTVNR